MTDNAIANANTAAPLRHRLAAMVYELLLIVAVLFIASFVFIRVGGDAQSGWHRELFRVFLLLMLFAYFDAFWRRG
jgi:hypothetical protein